MKKTIKRVTSVFLVTILLITSLTSVLAIEPTNEDVLPPAPANITTATESALISTADGQSLSITSALAYIYADTHSNGSFQFTGSQLIQNGACNAVNGITKNTAYSKIDLENIIDSFVLPDYTQNVINSIGTNFTNISSEIVTTPNISGNIKSEDNLAIKSNSMNAADYIVAKNNISITASSLRTNVDKPVFIVSEQGNVNITGSYADINGVIYAPNGTVTVNSSSFSLNGKIIAKNIIFQTTSISIKNNQSYFKKNISCEPTLELLSYDKNNLEFRLNNPNSSLNFFLQSRYIELPFEVVAELSSSNLSVKTPETAGIYSYTAVASIDDENAVNSNVITIAVTDNGVFPIGKDSDNDYLDDTTEAKVGTDKLNSDTDKDGLIDGLEYYYYSSDPKKADTDGDGLTDFQEVAYTYTSPVKADTDDNGTKDPDEDNDKDGLSNLEEVTLGTSLNSSDTDNDGLIDGDEVNKYKTDPLLFDTDGDSIGDSDEIKLGLNPLTKYTKDGILDTDVIFEQEISTEVLKNINTADNSFDLSVKINSTGYADSNLIAAESGYYTVMAEHTRL